MLSEDNAGYVAKMSDLDLNLVFEDLHASPLFASLMLPKSAFLESPKCSGCSRIYPDCTARVIAC